MGELSNARHEQFGQELAGWLGCGSTRIKLLRQRAQREFQGAPVIHQVVKRVVDMTTMRH